MNRKRLRPLDHAALWIGTFATGYFGKKAFEALDRLAEDIWFHRISLADILSHPLAIGVVVYLSIFAGASVLVAWLAAEISRSEHDRVGYDPVPRIDVLQRLRK